MDKVLRGYASGAPVGVCVCLCARGRLWLGPALSRAGCRGLSRDNRHRGMAAYRGAAVPRGPGAARGTRGRDDAPGKGRVEDGFSGALGVFPAQPSPRGPSTPLPFSQDRAFQPPSPPDRFLFVESPRGRGISSLHFDTRRSRRCVSCASYLISARVPVNPETALHHVQMW